MVEKQKEIAELARADCHVHPCYSIDAHGSPEQFITSALQLELEKICFTTHIDLDPRRDAADKYMRIADKWTLPDTDAVNCYLNEISELRKKYADKIEIFSGFELSYEPHFENIVRNFIRDYSPQFTIGSVHSVDSLEITSRAFIPAAVRVFKPHEFIPKYYETVVSLARSGLFSVIGHIDGYKKYLPRWWGLSLCEQIEGEILPDIAKNLGDAGAAIEINTSAWRKGLPAPYPSACIIRELTSAGVRIASIGSDAHNPQQLGYRLIDGARYAEAAIM